MLTLALTLQVCVLLNMNHSNVDCPLPKVAEALKSYIHTRAETANIRRAINSSFRSQNGQVDSITLLSPESAPSDKALDQCTGIRKAYANALRAHKAAQAKLENVRSEIQQLRGSERAAGDADHHNEEEALAVHNSISEIRQTQRRQKLRVIEQAFQDITAKAQERGDLEERLNELRKEEPPLLVLPQGEQAPTAAVDARVLELKKAVIVAHGEASKSRSRLMSSHQIENGSHETNSEIRVEALRTARDELIRLIELELAKLPDTTVESARIDPSPSVNASDTMAEGRPNQQDVQRLYDDYIAARKTLVTTLQDRAAEPPSLTNGSARQGATDGLNKPPHTLLATQILPYISDLRTCSEAEQALVEQSSYLRRQVAFSTDNIRRSRLRLADESLLVPPGAASALPWVDAAREARGDDAQHVEASLERGEESLRKAHFTIEGLRGFGSMSAL